MSSNGTIFRARSVITMNAAQPRAEGVLVRGDRIVAAGTLEELRNYGEVRLDERFADKIIVPGFVEGHCHSMEGGMWSFVYVGYYDRRGPDGTLWPGLQSIEAVVERLKQAERAMDDAARPLLAWGLDPILFGTRRMTVADLDQVSALRPILVLHANVHVLNVNTPVLEKAGITGSTGVEGIVRSKDGDPTGELQEFAAMFLAFAAVDVDFFGAGAAPQALWNLARLATMSGTTTVTDMLNDLPDTTVTTFKRTTDEDAFPVRLVSALNAMADTPQRGVKRLRDLTSLNGDRLRFGIVKLMTDGSIQSFTARLNPPGYHNGALNGMWNLTPVQLYEAARAFHADGRQLHIHTNGDEASDLALDTIERVLSEHPRWDHRHTIQHGQLLTEAHFRRIASLGMCVNLFANHLFYWGDIHYSITVGPERANRMNDAKGALANGLDLAIHCDAPVTPLAPLFTAWCAVNRRTASGRVLGPGRGITPAEALHAITLGAAYTLRMDHEIGSIESGKRADLAILDDDPLAVDPAALKDVRVWGTMLGGRIFEAGARVEAAS